MLLFLIFLFVLVAGIVLKIVTDRDSIANVVAIALIFIGSTLVAIFGVCALACTATDTREYSLIREQNERTIIQNSIDWEMQDNHISYASFEAADEFNINLKHDRESFDGKWLNWYVDYDPHKIDYIEIPNAPVYYSLPQK